MRDPGRAAVLYRLWLALLCLWASTGFTAKLLGADLQAATNEAAIEAKQSLCMALNQRRDTARLERQFFEFYEGQRIAGPRLHPRTFRIGEIGPIPAFDVVQVVGPDKMLVSVGSGMFFLENVRTADVADGQSISPTDWYQVGGTETYDTVAGSTKTVYVLKPCPEGKLPKVAATRVFPWYDKKDDVVVIGEFKAIDASRAVFLVNGTEERHALSKFTPGDRELLRMLSKRYPAEPAGPIPEQPLPEKPKARHTLD